MILIDLNLILKKCNKVLSKKDDPIALKYWLHSQHISIFLSLLKFFYLMLLKQIVFNYLFFLPFLKYIL